MSFLSRLGPPARSAQGRLRSGLDGGDDPDQTAPKRERAPDRHAPSGPDQGAPRDTAHAEAQWFETVRQSDSPGAQTGLRTAQILRAVGEMNTLGAYARARPSGVSGEILDADDMGGESARVIDPRQRRRP